MRARPLSITAVTPSMVIELSATLVERITLRWRRGRHGAILLGGRQIAIQREHQQIVSSTPAAAFARGAADLGRSGQKYQDVARVLAGKQLSIAAGHLFLERLCRVGLMRIVRGEEPAFGAKDRAAIQVSRDRARRRESPTSPPAASPAAWFV